MARKDRTASATSRAFEPKPNATKISTAAAREYGGKTGRAKRAEYAPARGFKVRVPTLIAT
jgi:hypothetical protein